MRRYAELELVRDLSSVAVGRRFVSSAVASWARAGALPAPDVLDDLLLVTTELLTNAVNAAWGAIRLKVEPHGQYVALSVTDDSPEPAVLRRVSDIDAEGGRGLAIVQALARRWGQSPYVDGCKTVWCEMALGAGAVLVET